MTQNYIEKCQVEISKSKSLETDKLMVYAYNDTFSTLRSHVTGPLLHFNTCRNYN